MFPHRFLNTGSLSAASINDGSRSIIDLDHVTAIQSRTRPNIRETPLFTVNKRKHSAANKNERFPKHENSDSKNGYFSPFPSLSFQKVQRQLEQAHKLLDKL
ncbi:hypothetical protein TNCV_223551 [Trichonephila clavipes]|nr:hypothetical protein TNCV_223551 [Trichonephila clavipes]